jgi:hypothetical protein
MGVNHRGFDVPKGELPKEELKAATDRDGLDTPYHSLSDYG